MVCMRLSFGVDYTADVLRDLDDKLQDCLNGGEAREVRDQVAALVV